jgi:hypothetical protein
VFADSAVEVVLKFHPLSGGKFERLKLPRNFRVWTPGGGTALRDEYDLVLFNDNSVGFESLLQGVRAYEYVCEPVYSEHRLYGFDIYDCVLDASRLPLIRDRIADGTLDKSLPVDAVSAYIESVYRPYTPAACRGLLELIDAAGVT